MRTFINELYNNNVEKPLHNNFINYDGGFMFSNKLTYLFLLILALAIFGCSENTTNINDDQGRIPTSIESPCGEQYYNFFIDQTTLAGFIRIANDLDNLYITYTLEGNYLAEPGEMHFWIGTNAPTKRGSPKQYTFHSTNNDYVNTYSFSLPISDLQLYISSGTFYFMTYASVVTQISDKKYSKASDGYSVDIVNSKSKGAWFGFNSYTLQSCGSE